MILMLQNDLNINSDCSNFHSLPDIKIKLKARKSYKSTKREIQEITLKPSDYLIEGNRIKNNFKGLDNEFLNLINEECQPAFMPIDVPAPRGPLFVFGEYFMRKFYTIFDRDESIIGLSLANHEENKEAKQTPDFITPYDEVDVNYENEKSEVSSNNTRNTTKDPLINANGSIEHNEENNLNFNKGNFEESPNKGKIEQIDFKKFIDTLKENLNLSNENKSTTNNVVDKKDSEFLKNDDIVNEMTQKDDSNNIYTPPKKVDELDLDLEIGENKNSNFLLNSEEVKLTNREINNYHLDLSLISEINTKSYLINSED